MSEDFATSVCIPNIGPRERRRRLIGGVIMLVIAGMLMTVLLARGGARPWRITAFIPLLSAISFMQVQQKTCIALAARNQRNLDRGVEEIADALELRAVKVQAWRVTGGAVAIALAITAAFVLM